MDVDITGGIFHGGSSSFEVIELSGAGGVDTLDIGSGVVVCRGSYSAGSCTAESGTAVSLEKAGIQAGSMTFKNAGSIFGDISASTPTTGSTITNQSGGAIVGAFTGGTGNDVVTNAGTWTMSSNFNFAAGTDSFTNSGTFIVHHAGATLAMNNLESFTLNSGGTLRFSLANSSIPTHALLNIGGATPTLAGAIALVLRDSGSSPTSGTVTLLTGTKIVSGTTDISGLSFAGAFGTFAIAGNALTFTFGLPRASSICGMSALPEFAAVSPGAAVREIICDSTDSLLSSSEISVSAQKVKLVYRGTQAGGSGAVASISNTGAGGEIHLESGSVASADDGAGTTVDSVRLSSGGTDPLRLVMASGVSVSNADTTSGSDAIYLSGGGSVFARVAGNTRATGGVAISATAAGTLDLDVASGTHASTSSVISATIASGGSGALDVDVAGGTLHGGDASNAVIALNGRRGADTLDISSGVVVCRGSYSASTCTPAVSGLAVSLGKTGTQAGSVAFTNAGSIWGGVSLATVTVGSTVANSAGGAIAGAFQGGSGNDVVTNAGTWTLSSSFDFAGGTDSFANSGTLTVRHSGSTLAMSNLESFLLQTGSTLRFSLADNTLPSSALLNIGGATPTFVGTVDLAARNGLSFPTSGAITVIAGTNIPDGTSVSSLTLAGAYGLFRIASNSLVLDLSRAPFATDCGDTIIRRVVAPGVANMTALCDSTDSLTGNSDISVGASKVAVVFRGTQVGGTGNIKSLSNTGAGGEIHIESGSVDQLDNGDATAVDAVVLSNAGTDALRLVTASGAAVTNVDPSSESDAVVVTGGGDVSVTVAGSTSAAGGVAISATAGTLGALDLDITGGTHTSPKNVILASGGTGALDVDITGGVLHGGSASVLRSSP